jgi:hypothetical protein
LARVEVVEEEEVKGCEMRHIRMNTGAVDVWLVKYEVLKCSPPSVSRGVDRKTRIRGVLQL